MPRAFKIYPKHPAVAFLVNLHADIGGRLKANRDQADLLMADMKHVEAVIRMFDPAYDMHRITLRRRNRESRWYKRGTMFRAVIDVLKAADGPLTAREVTVRMFARLGHADPSLDDIRELQGGVRSCLSQTQGRIVQNVAQGMPARWVISRGDDSST